jgi:hypothetical protein
VTIRDAIEQLRRAGVVYEDELPGKVADLLGDVTAEEVAAVLAEMRAGEPEVEYRFERERALAAAVARIAHERDEAFAFDLYEAARGYLEQFLGDVMELDAESELRTRARRLRYVVEAFEPLVWPGPR